MNKDVFCIHPWSAITINPQGDFRVCCFSGENSGVEYFDHNIVVNNNRGLANDDNEKRMNVLTTPLTNVLNSKIHKEIRKHQIENKRHPACNICWGRDDAAEEMTKKTGKYVSSNSMRIADSFGKKFDINLSQENFKTSDDGTLDFPVLLSLDIRFDNLCNMKCIMCQPTYSNLWYEDWIKLHNTTTFNRGPDKFNIIQKENGNYTTDFIDWQNSDIWWKQVDEIKHNLRHLYITGGEPFLSKSHNKLLDILIKDDFAKNITLEYDTNMSVINPKIINQLNKFKKIVIRMSIDDTEERYELIRFPGKWQTLIKNIETLEKSEIYNKIELSIALCLGTYSLFSPLRVYSKFGKKYQINTRLLEFPGEYDIKYLSSDMKKKVIEVYDKADIPILTKSLIVGHLTKTLNQINDKKSKKHIEYFYSRMNKLDEIRGTNWKKTFPEIVSLLET